MIITEILFFTLFTFIDLQQIFICIKYILFVQTQINEKKRKTIRSIGVTRRKNE